MHKFIFFAIKKYLFAMLKLLAPCGLLLFACASLAGCGSELCTEQYDQTLITGLDADYYIDYKNGTISIGDLPIGARVVDPSWVWEFRLGFYYSNYLMDHPTGPSEVKPVTWIVVAKDHYYGLKPHVTLLSEDLIGLYPFDNSTDRDHAYAEYGYNHWGESGSTNATLGLRPWLNSTDIHYNEGFYIAFSKSFKKALLRTTLPNKEWENGVAYTTEDQVFIPSTTELGDEDHDLTYEIGFVYPYFTKVSEEERIAKIVGDNWRNLLGKAAPGYMEELEIIGNRWPYWTRSPHSIFGGGVIYVNREGKFIHSFNNLNNNSCGARPALNLKAGTPVSKVMDQK